MSGRTCTCGGRFMDAEDFRDHLPCDGSPLERAQVEVARLRAALVWIADQDDTSGARMRACARKALEER